MAAGCRRLVLAAPDIARAVKPGQFLHVRCDGGTHAGYPRGAPTRGTHVSGLGWVGSADLLLRRPLSVYDADRERGTVTILYRVVGRGTALLAEKRTGGRVNVLGPLGRGFEPPGYPRGVPTWGTHVSGSGWVGHRRVAIVGGGLGVAPLFFLARELSAGVSEDARPDPTRPDPLGVPALAGRVPRAGAPGGYPRVPARPAVAVFQGARTAPELDLADFSVLPVDLFTATDDGSRGYAGSVVELFLDTVCHEPVDWVSAAGPPGMLRALAGALQTLGLPGEFSLEERMGCGIGACVCCSCRIGTPERWEYRRVCADGPVFPAREVVWE